MYAEIIAIGTELLLGATVDTNSAYLEQQLATVGIAVQRVTLVRDDLPEMIEVIHAATQRVELVICSGGLGPTGDDLTREAIAAAVDCPLEFHQELFDDIIARFEAYRRTMSPSNRQQAYVPQGAYVIRNPRGTAPAFVAEHRSGDTLRMVAALPGVPQELMYLTEHGLLPYLRDERGVNDIIVVREVIVAGLPESVAGERIFEMMNLPNPVVGITVKRGQHTIRIAATATSREDAEALIAPLVATIEERFAGYIVDAETLEAQVGRLLAEHNTALVLREVVPEAPVFRLLSTTAGGRTALLQGATIVRRWSVAEGDLNETVLVGAAATELSTSLMPDQHGIALVVVPAPEQAGDDYRTVHFALTDGTRPHYFARGFDLRSATGYDLIASTALDLLRNRLQAATPAPSAGT
jgi:competence/damage-inducible protein CinA-like protein